MTIATVPRPASVVVRVCYAALFLIVLPALLVLWAIGLDRWLSLPVYRAPAVGWLLTITGLMLMAAAMRDLWVHGRGLPASPFPPQRLVTVGVYRFIANPIYVGAVAVAFGLSLLAGSPAALWVVSPTLAMAVAAFVVGFERDATTRRFGAIALPLLRIPGPASERPAGRDRLSVYVLVFLPWLVCYQAVESLGIPPDAIVAHFPWEMDLPVLPWTEAIYAITYVFVLAGPLVAKRVCDLRSVSPERTLGHGNHHSDLPARAAHCLWMSSSGRRVLAIIMLWERAFDQPVTAFPSFHVVWTCLAARLWTTTYPQLTAVWWTLTAAVAVSCITTGMHAIVDVLAGLAIFVAIERRQILWRHVCAAAERLANDWKELDIGLIRLMSHGVFAAAGAMTGVLVSVYLAGGDSASWILVLTAAAVLGAGLWGQLVEGSQLFLRPYGDLRIRRRRWPLRRRVQWHSALTGGWCSPPLASAGLLRRLSAGCVVSRRAAVTAVKLAHRSVSYTHPPYRWVGISAHRAFRQTVTPYPGVFGDLDAGGWRSPAAPLGTCGAGAVHCRHLFHIDRRRPVCRRGLPGRAADSNCWRPQVLPVARHRIRRFRCGADHTVFGFSAGAAASRQHCCSDAARRGSSHLRCIRGRLPAIQSPFLAAGLAARCHHLRGRQRSGAITVMGCVTTAQ